MLRKVFKGKFVFLKGQSICGEGEVDHDEFVALFDISDCVM